MPGRSSGLDVGDEVEGNLGKLRCESGGVVVPTTEMGAQEEQVKGERGHIHSGQPVVEESG